MDMDEILDVLYEVAVGSDPVYQEGARRYMEETQPYYDRLCQALGDKEGDQFWNAISALIAAQEDGAFRSGLRLGLRLMALCF